MRSLPTLGGGRWEHGGPQHCPVCGLLVEQGITAAGLGSQERQGSRTFGQPRQAHRSPAGAGQPVKGGGTVRPVAVVEGQVLAEDVGGVRFAEDVGGVRFAEDDDVVHALAVGPVIVLERRARLRAAGMEEEPRARMAAVEISTAPVSARGARRDALWGRADVDRSATQVPRGVTRSA